MNLNPFVSQTQEPLSTCSIAAQVFGEGACFDGAFFGAFLGALFGGAFLAEVLAGDAVEVTPAFALAASC